MEAKEWTVRPATVDDVGLLLEARHHMFADMGEPDAPHRAMGEARVAEWLAQGIPEGRAGGFVAEDAAGVFIGGVSVSHEETVPSRHNPDGRHSYLFGMWVSPAWRRRGVASALVSAAADDARERGEGAVTLFTSDLGRPVYERLGFQAAPAMRLFFEPEGPGSAPAAPGGR